MHVYRLTTLDELNRLANAWNALSGDMPFRRHEWLAGWWQHYGVGKELYALCIEECAELIGLAPFYLERSMAGGRALRLLGDGEVCSDYVGLLCRPQHAARVATAAADWLVASAGDALHGWDSLRLEGVEAQDTAISELSAELAARGCLVRKRPGANCWRLELPANWSAYEALLSKTHRKRVRRLIDRVLDRGRARLCSVEHPKELERGQEILIDLHQRRRQALGEPGCFASPTFTAFQSTVLPKLLAAGLLQLDWLELDGVPAAVEYSLASQGVVYGYQSGVAPELMDEEPGRLLAITTLRRAIEQGYTSFDFLRGDEPYKANFRAQPRPLVEYRIAPRRPAARLRHHAWSVRESVKDWWRTTRNQAHANRPSETTAQSSEP